ncbi:MAG TPA: tripartite tricarboxylate transporter TctB family protein [Plasticicumulans sp.]|uniref:tripartite tricarboxylate transporter TctB family protein n=1 Tax=Plasticicumulans sp. TaxID=2307179 RepID=UPI002C653F67|nr:tripartite tricarboxylate transporter TctB family protein [Plasticicumulans sp.]MBS0602732.1 tripartite tricarboxylate transporter TctB family protein [Pseudomonadota bacterium]HMW31041.1 tripartite tricarboxylate transporter TctB family protein [Plasticicumulans sp.]HND99863.1 tripartite tricarboxylate transporter TctB family protein [Plasticicumulans sp.]HNE00776.1 tripartite tricarboxylate transporter TctB family protein [Plasticicumulans sp.]HNF67458.1 tripartite tricarboxylate transpor
MFHDPRDGLVGLALAATGAGALWIARRYPAGTAADLGPGFLPGILGALLLLLGLLMAAGACRGPRTPFPVLQLRPLLAVLGGVVLFGLLLRSAGLLVASSALVLLASAGLRGAGWRVALIEAVVLGVLAVAVFVHGLGLRLPVWPAGLPWN